MGLLALLAEGPSHGYHLKASFESRTGGVWSLNVGQVYTTLDRLLADGLVAPVELDEAEPPDGRDRRSWRITTAGKAALEAWFEEPSAGATPPRDELLVKVLLALGRSRSEALAVIDLQRAELYRLTQATRRTARSAPSTADLADLASNLMAEAVRARHEADLRWLDHCETAIISRTTEGTTR